MSDDALAGLATAAGIAVRWSDAFGEEHGVAPPTLRLVLAALGLPAGSDAEIADSRAALSASGHALPPLLTAEQGQPIHLPCPPGPCHLVLEDGRSFERMAEPDGEGSRIPAILEPGYHRLAMAGAETVLAVAPPRCVTAPERIGGRGWGIAVQLYALRRAGDGGLGDFAALRDFVRHAATRGASAVAISPVHAQFSADPDRFSPYAPSSRVMLNVLHAPLHLEGAEAERLSALDLVDWPAAGRLRLQALHQAHAQASAEDRAAFERFRAALGPGLENHARFEALHAHVLAQDPARWHWRDWPAEFRDPAGTAVARFAEQHAQDVERHAYAQFLADRGLGAAQQAARDAGMAIGLVADLAVGTDSGGSHCWSRQDETLPGMTVGAPPDLMSRDGQGWGLAAFSPRGLREHGFSAYIEMLRAALRHAGGVRIDHGMGIARLWVVPDGAKASEGAYLAFPEADLSRLIRLESRRHDAIVLAEDLGTVPEGFQDRLQAAGVDGMRVLWFERAKDGAFTRPAGWTRGAAAMTSTHDLPTVAGWWRGQDMDWRARLDLMRDEAKERGERAADRTALWDAFATSGAASGPPPAPDAGEAVADAACRHVGASACGLVMLPVEDALGLVEQPNLPGTLDEHPNWRRRLPGPADTLLDAPAVRDRLEGLAAARQS